MIVLLKARRRKGLQPGWTTGWRKCCAIRVCGCACRPLLHLHSYLPALIFHQVHMAEIKDWSPSLVAWSFGLAAVMSVTSTILAGPSDRLVVGPAFDAVFPDPADCQLLGALCGRGRPGGAPVLSDCLGSIQASPWSFSVRSGRNSTVSPIWVRSVRSAMRPWCFHPDWHRRSWGS